MNEQLNATLSEFFDPGLLERINGDTADGSGLPNVAYIDPAFYEAEQRTVFRQSWSFAGFAHQLPEVGDMVPVTVGGQSIVLVRSDESIIRAFHNVCRHRGARLIEEAKFRSRTFVCPNHSWSYSLDGRLIARPHFHGGDAHDVNRQSCHRADLVAVRCDVWFDWVFVNLDGSAPVLSEYIRPVTDRLEGYRFEHLHHASSLQFDLNANWKLAVENFIEPYHVFSCHPWLNSFVSMAERAPPAFEDHMLYCNYEFQKVDPARGQGLPYFPDLPESRQKTGEWFVLFPNFAFEIFPDQVDVFIAEPLGVEKTRETIALYFIGEGATAERYQSARDHVIQNWHDLNLEDIGVIERMQAGRHSDGFDGGVLSPYWDPVQQHIARLVIAAMNEPEEKIG